MTLMEKLTRHEIKELLGKCWITHDAMWFAHSLFTHGIDEANRLNRAAIKSMSINSSCACGAAIARRRPSSSPVSMRRTPCHGGSTKKGVLPTTGSNAWRWKTTINAGCCTGFNAGWPVLRSPLKWAPLLQRASWLSRAVAREALHASSPEPVT